MNPKYLATEISLTTLADNDAFLPLKACDMGHDIYKIQKMSVYSCSNTILNNYCARINDTLSSNKAGRKRKLETLTK